MEDKVGGVTRHSDAAAMIYLNRIAMRRRGRLVWAFPGNDTTITGLKGDPDRRNYGAYLESLTKNGEIA